MASTASRLLEVVLLIFEFWNVAKALLIIFCYLESQEDFFQVANSEEPLKVLLWCRKLQSWKNHETWVLIKRLFQSRRLSLVKVKRLKLGEENWVLAWMAVSVTERQLTAAARTYWVEAQLGKRGREFVLLRTLLSLAQSDAGFIHTWNALLATNLVHLFNYKGL